MKLVLKDLFFLCNFGKIFSKLPFLHFKNGDFMAGLNEITYLNNSVQYLASGVCLKRANFAPLSHFTSCMNLAYITVIQLLTHCFIFFYVHGFAVYIICKLSSTCFCAPFACGQCLSNLRAVKGKVISTMWMRFQWTQGSRV